ncbi:phosphotransferase family protein [Nocardia pseudobrasiliensis]|uniref:Phosphotransferase family enzyme n=1 Tax=Nocardia pseudobrasiliensis TaxID=45979 RepID=A0A370I983_9NOCA|nr:aminoglycoside phosphotransferase family protein [Nocardia pseudobrasiliensis]RDI67279.1 phosphotransferase family enzyme [Nocardia pseudobrasiliensis]
MGGQLSGVYEVCCAEPAASVIVKIYDERWRWKQAKEVHVYRVLDHHDIGSAPEILYAEHDTRVIGAAFTVMTVVPGQPLSQISAGLDSADLIRIYRQLGANLSAIHRIRQVHYGYLTTEVIDPEPDNSSYMIRQFTKKLREFRHLGGDPQVHDAIGRYLDPRIESFARCAAPVLCHNDFHEGNVLIRPVPDGWEVSGFIDVENAIAADPLIDLAKTDYYAIQGNADKRTGLFDGYGPLPDDWPDRFALYRLYHALELWDWFASIGNMSPLPGIAEDIRTMT